MNFHWLNYWNFKKNSDICKNPKKIMSRITSFNDLTRHLTEMKKQPTVAVVCPYDEDTCGAVRMALADGLIRAVLVGEREKIEAAGLPAEFPELTEIVEAADKKEAAAKGVQLTHDKKADILMKGLVGTDDLLRAVLNKEYGILPKGEVLSHLTVSEIPGLDRLLFFSDVAVIPYPTIDQRRRVIELDLDVIRKFGISHPYVALIHFTEKVNPKFQNSVDYQELIAECNAGNFGEAELAGPMDVKTAMDRHSAQVKGIESAVCGNANLLIFPNIESGNTFYKTISYFAHAEMAGMLVGTTAPVVLPSRADSARSKYNSLALASMAVE